MSDVSEPRLRVDDFDYDLPPTAIAQVPVEPRDASRLLVLDRATGGLEHATFADIGRWLAPEDLLVVNDSRVIPARLRGTRAGGGAAEILVLRQIEDDPARWEALVRPSRRVGLGATITLATGATVEVGERLDAGTRAIGFDGDPHAVMDAAGEMPLPPYIRDRSTPGERYQTVYARPPGSAAAPTAGLHFTAELLTGLEGAGVRRASVTLHVGLDTFRPLEGEFIDEHRIHREWFEVPPATREADARRRSASWRSGRPPSACSRRRPGGGTRPAGPTCTSRRRIGSARSMRSSRTSTCRAARCCCW